MGVGVTASPANDPSMEVTNRIHSAETPWAALNVVSNAKAAAIDAAFKRDSEQIAQVIRSSSDSRQINRCERAATKLIDAAITAKRILDGADPATEVAGFKTRWSVAHSSAPATGPVTAVVQLAGAQLPARRVMSGTVVWGTVVGSLVRSGPATGAATGATGPAIPPTRASKLTEAYIARALELVARRVKSVVTEFTTKVEVIRWTAVPLSGLVMMAACVAPKLATVANWTAIDPKMLMAEGFYIGPMVGVGLSFLTLRGASWLSQKLLYRDFGAILGASEMQLAQHLGKWLEKFKFSMKYLEGRDLALIIGNAETDPTTRINAVRALVDKANGLKIDSDKFRFELTERNEKFQQKRNNLEDKHKNGISMDPKIPFDKNRNRLAIEEWAQKTSLDIEEWAQRTKGSFAQRALALVQELRGVANSLGTHRVFTDQEIKISFTEAVHHRLFWWIRDNPANSWLMRPTVWITAANLAISVPASFSVAKWLTSLGW